VASGQTLRVLEGHTGQVNAATIVFDKIYSISADKTLRQWQLAISPTMQWIDLAEKTRAIAISPDNKYYAVGYKNGTIALYKKDNLNQPIWEIKDAHEKRVVKLDFDEKENLLASASSDKTAKLWQMEDGVLLKTIEHEKYVRDVAFSKDNKYLATASLDGQIALLSLADKKLEHHAITAKEKQVRAINFSSETPFFVTADTDNVKIWQQNGIQKPKLIQELKDVPDQLDWAIFSPDNNWLAVTGGNPTTVYVFENNNNQFTLKHQFVGHTDTVTKAFFTPDSQLLATLGVDKTLRVWDLEDSSELFKIQLPIPDNTNVWDFDFNCTEKLCQFVIPIDKSLLIYHLDKKL